MIIFAILILNGMNNFDLIRVSSIMIGLVNFLCMILWVIIWATVPIKGLLLKIWRIMIYAAPIFTFTCGIFISYLGCLNLTNFLLSVFAWMLVSFFLFAMVNISDKKLYGEKISEADNILLHNQITCDLIRWAKQDGSEITEDMRIAMSVYLLEFRNHNSEAQNSDIFNKLFKSCYCELNPEEQAKLEKALGFLIK